MRVFLASWRPCPPSTTTGPWLVLTGPVPSGTGMGLHQPSRQERGRKSTVKGESQERRQSGWEAGQMAKGWMGYINSWQLLKYPRCPFPLTAWIPGEHKTPLPGHRQEFINVHFLKQHVKQSEMFMILRDVANWMQKVRSPWHPLIKSWSSSSACRLLILIMVKVFPLLQGLCLNVDGF